MKIRLSTDYLDCYDHQFDLVGERLFRRSAKDSWATSRRRMFEIFDELFLDHPRFGEPGIFSKETDVVLYFDEYAHCGDGDLFTMSESDAIRPTGFERRILNPVWAIDFVAERQKDGQPRLLAIDFNTAPKVAGTPMREIFSATQLANGCRDIVERLVASNLHQLLTNKEQSIIRKAQIRADRSSSIILDNNIVIIAPK